MPIPPPAFIFLTCSSSPSAPHLPMHSARPMVLIFNHSGQAMA